ncbi:MAG: DUF4954 family protein [Ignavibacteriae bacterium]|nr:DUF4954 family protein [Ignavibacteriota bacterium]
MGYINLTEQEIMVLTENMCVCNDWEQVLVKEGFQPNNVRKVKFDGIVKLGNFSKTLRTNNNVEKQSGIYHSRITNCELADNVRISNVNMLLNYSIDEGTIVENVNNLIVTEKNSFGVGEEIEILNEGGGREMPLLPELTSQLAYILIHYKNDNELQKNISQLVQKETENSVSDIGIIGKNVQISNVKEIKNVNINDGAQIHNAASLVNGSIICSTFAPAFVGSNVIAKNFIIQSGARVDSSVLLENSFVGEATSLGKQYSVENSAFFANCEGFHGEACSIFAGPYTVTHHKSSLLIASYYSFFNAGSGTNHSNHMYKLGPIHQGILERGSKTGSLSYLLLPSRVGPFSVVIGKHFSNFDASDFPFSYISDEDGKNILTPAMNLFTVGTKRDTEKWASRDKRKSDKKLDKISFDFYSPFIVGRMVNAFNTLDKFYKETPKKMEFVKFKGMHIPRLLLRTCKKYYDLGIKVGIGEHLLKTLNNSESNSVEEIIKELNSNSSTSNEKWLDIGGLFISESDWKDIRNKITHNEITSIEALNNAFEDIHKSYNSSAWYWYSYLLKEKYAPDSEVSSETLLKVLDEWRKSKIKLLNMTLKDGEKEFDINSKIGYGIDGDEKVINSDFENVRGTYEENKFIVQLKKEIEETNLEAEKITKLLSSHS